MSQDKYKIYMLGIAGMGMGPLAIYLAQSGHDIVGIDDNIRPELMSLFKKNCVKIDVAKKLPIECDFVIYSSAISENNSIFQEALDRKIPLIRRGTYLAKITENKKLIAIVGSHGKTTTAAMLIHALMVAQFEFSFILGALFSDSNVFPSYFSHSDWVVAEVDESDGTIDDFKPEITLVVNFDWDHPSQYASVEDLEDTFLRLFNRTGQVVIIPNNCPHLNKLSKKNLSCKVLTYGAHGDFQARSLVDSQGITSLFTMGVLSEQQILIPNGGLFNAHNALAALSVVYFLLKVLPCEPFKSFLGVRRRQESLYRVDNFHVMMDYAHHPTEIEALLHYVHSSSPNPSLVIFQPHRYTRTQAYCKDFARVLSYADRVILLPVYAASEAFLDAGVSQKIADVFPESKDKLTLIENSYQALFKELPVRSDQGAYNILFVGAGDIEVLALQYKEQVERSDWWQSCIKVLDPASKRSENEPLASKTTLRVGGLARFYIEPASLVDLIKVIKESNALKCPIFILGRGSNLVIPDEGFDGLVIRLNHPYWKEIRDLGCGRIWAGAGARLKEICGYACKFGLAGFEFLEGIPGSLGGSLRMNAGAMGSWLFDIIESIKYITQDGFIKELPTEALTLGYRFCKDLENAFAIGAVLKSSQIEKQQVIRTKLDGFANKRKTTQPREPSAGCVFKNPEHHFAGALIEDAGLKGYSVGGAEVSGVHANFIINNGNATSKDIVQLVRVIRDRVHSKNGIYLEPEVLFLGKKWDEALGIEYHNNG